jgi:hypothetical protein
MPVFLSEYFEDWIRRTLGIPRSPLHSLKSDDDWTFVIKMHAIVETALNHLLMIRLNNPKLSDIIAKLETNDRRKGKMAFVKKHTISCRKIPAYSCKSFQKLEIMLSITQKALT